MPGSTSFARGLGADADVFGCPLLGGDTVRTPGPITISVAAFGAVPHGKMVRRAGARPGDRVVVTGTIGDAALGLLLRRDAAAAERWGLARDQRDHLAARYLVPEPRSAIAAFLAAATRRRPWTCPTVSPAISPSSAAPRASPPRSQWRACRSPTRRALRVAKEPALIETIVTGGDDYEVLACVPAEQGRAFAPGGGGGGRCDYGDRDGDGGGGRGPFLRTRRQAARTRANLVQSFLNAA